VYQFWTERLGFQKTMDSARGKQDRFAIVEKNGLELMYQSFASADRHNAATGARRAGGRAFCIRRGDLDAAQEPRKERRSRCQCGRRSITPGNSELKISSGHFYLRKQGAAPGIIATANYARLEGEHVKVVHGVIACCHARRRLLILSLKAMSKF